MIAILENRVISMHFFSNLCDNDPFFIRFSQEYLQHVNQVIGNTIYQDNAPEFWIEEQGMNVWYSSPIKNTN
jgi:hypothetical protein